MIKNNSLPLPVRGERAGERVFSAPRNSASNVSREKPSAVKFDFSASTHNAQSTAIRQNPLPCPLPAYREREAVVSLFVLFLFLIAGCSRQSAVPEVVVYCGVDEPYASKCFEEFEKQTGLHIAAQYDIESSKSVGLAGKLEAEKAHPRADVWWGSEAFLSVRLADEGVLQAYDSPVAAEIPDGFKDAGHRWAGVGLRARVLAISQATPPPFEVKSIHDLLDPRLKDKIAISRPTAGATGAHVAALYTIWGPQKGADFFRALHVNGIAALGGNAEVADQVGAGIYSAGLTDSDDVLNTLANGGKLSLVVPDQTADAMGTLAMPTTVGLIEGAQHVENSKKLIDFLLSKANEQHLIDQKFARWSVRGGVGDPLKSIALDYRAAAKIYPQAQREATAILDGRTP